MSFNVFWHNVDLM